MKTLTTVASVLAIAFAGSALAAQPATKPSSDSHASASTSRPAFDALDTNKDGMISGSEAAANTWVKDHFAKFDADKNGNLSRSEYAKEMAGA
jgi:Ca2+-binding EF-hand superfamily protein